MEHGDQLAVDAVFDARCLAILELRGEELRRFLHRGNHCNSIVDQNRRPPASQGDYADLAWVRRQRVQTRAVWERPSMVTRALCKLGMKRRFVCTFEWLT